MFRKVFAVGFVVLLLAGCQGGGEAGFHNDQGIQALAQDRYEEARVNFEKALELTPEDAVVWGNLGVALTRLERYEDALAAYQKADSIDPGEPVTVAEIASIHYRLGHYDEAEAGFRKALSMVKTAPEFRSSLSLALLRQGKAGEAAAEMEKAVDVAKKDWHRHGLVKYQMAASEIIGGHVDRGLDLFAEALDVYPAGARMSVSDHDFEPVYENPRYQELAGGWWKRLN